MFYQTKLKSVQGDSAVDVNGKRLKFVGYNPAQAGDIVWTDGKVIFGNAALRSTPLLDNPKGGIPILGDDLRGYVKKSGNYKNYNIAQDNWIVNDSKTFFHGNEDNLLDVEIVQNSTLNTDKIIYKAVPSNDKSILYIYHNDILSESIILDNSCNIAEINATDYAENIISDDPERFTSNIENSFWWRCITSGYIPYSESHTQILGLRIDENGDCHAIVASWHSLPHSIKYYYIRHTYRFYSYSSSKTYTVGDPYVDSYLANLPHIPDIIDDLVNRIVKITEYVRTYTYDDLGIAESYSNEYDLKNFRPAFTCFSYVLAYFKNWQLEKIVDHNYFQTFFKINDYMRGELSTSRNENSEYLGQIGFTKKVVGASAGFHTIEVLENTEELQDCYQEITTTEYSNAGYSDESLFNTFMFSLQDGYTAEMSIWQIKAIYDSDGKKICGELPIQYPNAFLEDFSAVTDDNGDIDVNWLEKRRIYADGSSETFSINVYDGANYCGFFYYDDNGQKQDYLMPNVSVTKLSTSKYLVGFHNGNLYLINDGNIQKLTENDNDNLKNFRLRELKNIAKAKK